jgi:hypothetical protein
VFCRSQKNPAYETILKWGFLKKNLLRAFIGGHVVSRYRAAFFLSGWDRLGDREGQKFSRAAAANRRPLSI